MSRRIVTQQLQVAGRGGEIDTYFDRLLRYIPADIVGAWVAASSIIAAASDTPKDVVLWIAFLIGVGLTAAWTWKQTSAPNLPVATTQIVLSTVAFIVWVFALGGPFAGLDFYRPVYGSLLLLLYTLIVALITPPEG